MMQIVLSVRYALGVAVLIAFALSLAVHVAAVAGFDVEAHFPDVWLLHYGIFPAIASAVLAVAAPGAGFRDAVARIPIWARVLIVATFVYAITNLFVVGPLTGAGEPVLQDGRFFFDDHGILREVSEAQFHAQGSLALRLFSAHWLYLYLVSAVCLLFARRTRQK